MDRMRRIAGMGKAKSPSVIQKDKDESIVFFRELYKREKDRDVNLLEPMYSMEFDTIQGGHMSKLTSGKRDFLITVDEKHDYDWLKTPPATPLFASLEMETNSSGIVIQQELPIPRPVKPSASRLSGKAEAAKTSARSASTCDPSSKKNSVKGATAFSGEKNQPYIIEKRSTYKALTNSQHKTASATTAATATNAAKKHSDRCYASQGSNASAVKRVTNPGDSYKAPKNLLSAGSTFARHKPTAVKPLFKDPALGVDVKEESSRTRTQSCPPAATRRGMKEMQLEGKLKVWPAKEKAVTGTDSEHASGSDVHAGEATLVKRTPKFGSQMNK